ncbi:Gldg family protein [Salinimicrobium sp. WS361]|uniref:Gldg family protein n=1 Tax=Salinimicrobium sp. WS361 TaxID=3425123 RepID=UPI003D6ECA21
MKKIFRIARLELAIMFFSPIAWLVLIIFIIQTGLTFTELLYSQETYQQLGRKLPPMSKVLFAGEEGILATVQKNLYLYIPLLTMGLFSRETSSGSIKLLLSSPVTVTQMVMGKFLSMMVYTLLLAMVLGTFIGAGMISIEALDIKFVLGGILGIYLLMLAYSAIGLFMSTLTSYQVVAAINTLAVLAFFNFIGEVGQAYDFIRDIAYWLSISGRADNFVNGLISSKDLIYFLLVTGLFLALTIIKLQDERETRSKKVKFVRYSTAIILVVAIGYITSLPAINAYYDTTRFKDRTLTKTSQDLVSELEEPIVLNTYVNAVHRSASYGAPENRISDLNRFEQYRRFMPEMEMNYVVYYDTLQYNDTTTTLLEKAKKAASAHKFDFDEMLPPKEIKKTKDLVPENNRLVRFMEYKGEQTPLRMFDDMYVYPGESEISAAIKRLISGPARVGLLQGNNERKSESMEDAGYQIITKGVNIRGSLINQGFEVSDILIDEIDSIPRDIEVLIVSDPKSSYTQREIQKIQEFIAAGGNMLIAGEPGRQSLLNPILQELGMAFAPGTLLQETKNFEPDLLQAVFTPQARELGYGFYDDAVVTMPDAMAIQVSDSTEFKVTPILITDHTATWNKIEEFDLNTEKVRFNPETDQKVLAPVALALERDLNEHKQKIMVIGDADFLSNAEMNRNSPRSVNSSFVIRMFRWFSDGEYPVNTARKAAIDNVIKFSRFEIQWLKGFYTGIIPVVLGGLGMFILIRRKRR